MQATQGVPLIITSKEHLGINDRHLNQETLTNQGGWKTGGLVGWAPACTPPWPCTSSSSSLYEKKSTGPWTPGRPSHLCDHPFYFTHNHFVLYVFGPLPCRPSVRIPQAGLVCFPISFATSDKSVELLVALSSSSLLGAPLY